MIRLNDSPGFEFRPVDRDTFQRRGMIARVPGHDAASVARLDYGNPVLRPISFTRMSERPNGR